MNDKKIKPQFLLIMTITFFVIVIIPVLIAYTVDKPIHHIVVGILSSVAGIVSVSLVILKK